MAMTEPSISAESSASRAKLPGARAPSLRSRMRGGPDGNEQLTAATGVVLIILLAVLGVTIVRIGQLIWLHLFLGLLVLGPIILKMGSTGYRFARYYVKDATYRRKGPPETWLRLIAPIVVLTTIGVFVTGILLLIVGPANRQPLAEIHKVMFIVWVVFTAFHVLGHLPAMPEALRIRRETRDHVRGLQPGTGSRTILLAGALVAGLVLAIVLIPDFSAWTASSSTFHHHRHG
jgi:hypothetical protein